MTSNVPIKASYGVFSSQIYRFLNINSESSNFCNDVREMTEKLVSQGFKRNKLRFTFRQFLIDREPEVVSKYWMDLSMLNNII